MNFSQIFQLKVGSTCERPQALCSDVEARYHFALPLVKGKKTLDIGCAFGVGSHYLATRGAKKVLGIDSSLPTIKQARRTFSLPNLEFKLMDATKIKLRPDSFNTAIAFELIGHLPPNSHEEFIKGVKKVLQKDSVFLLSTPNKLFTSPGRKKPLNPYHLKEFEPAELKKFLSYYFPKVKVKGLRCTDKDYLKKREQLRKSWRWQISAFAVRFKFLSELSTILPRDFRLKISDQHDLPVLDSTGFEISDQLKKAENLIVICKTSN